MTVTFVVVTVLVFTVLVAVTAVRAVIRTFEEAVIAAPTPTLSLTEDVEVYVMGERPNYVEYEGRIDAMYEKYVVDATTETILQYVPYTEEGMYYYKDFVYILSDQRSALRFSRDLTGTDPDELDFRISVWDAELTELERKFLASEPFDIGISIVHADGTEYTSTGTEAPLSREQAEEFARTYVAVPDANGSYVEAAQAVTQEFGLYLTWDENGGSDMCSRVQDVPLQQIAATYCIADPHLIYVNTSYSGYPDITSDDLFVDVIKHETAHSIIGQVCGTTRPPVAGADYEGVTNSYAVLYLGGDRDNLSLSAEVDSHYTMTAATDAAATEIHEGRCS